MFIQGVHHGLSGLTGVPVVKRVSTSLVKITKYVEIIYLVAIIFVQNLPEIKIMSDKPPLSDDLR